MEHISTTDHFNTICASVVKIFFKKEQSKSIVQFSSDYSLHRWLSVVNVVIDY